MTETVCDSAGVFKIGFPSRSGGTFNFRDEHFGGHTH